MYLLIVSCAVTSQGLWGLTRQQQLMIGIIIAVVGALLLLLCATAVVRAKRSKRSKKHVARARCIGLCGNRGDTTKVAVLPQARARGSTCSTASDSSRKGTVSQCRAFDSLKLSLIITSYDENLTHWGQGNCQLAAGPGITSRSTT